MKQLCLSLLLAFATSTFAQSGAPNTPGVNPLLLRVFGDIKTFTASAEIRVLENQQESTTMPVTMALLDGKMRTEMDMTQIKSVKAPAEAMAMLKGTGMDRLITIMQPDRKSTVLIYPGLQAYTEIAISEAEAANPKFEISELGKETIDGHACTKTKLVSTGSDGRKQEILVWKGTELKGFPIQVQTQEGGSTVIVRYQSPKLEKPDASLFTPPANYTKHASFQALMQAAVMKMLGK